MDGSSILRNFYSRGIQILFRNLENWEKITFVSSFENSFSLFFFFKQIARENCTHNLFIRIFNNSMTFVCRIKKKDEEER